MKAITIKEPWISQIISGLKTIEVRSWTTKHRGKLILTASKSSGGPYAGKAIAIVNLDNIRPLKKNDKKNTGGFYAPNHYAWEISRIKKIKPFNVRGWPGLFDVKKEIFINNG